MPNISPKLFIENLKTWGTLSCQTDNVPHFLTW